MFNNKQFGSIKNPMLQPILIPPIPNAKLTRIENNNIPLAPLGFLNNSNSLNILSPRSQILTNNSLNNNSKPIKLDINNIIQPININLLSLPTSSSPLPLKSPSPCKVSPSSTSPLSYILPSFSNSIKTLASATATLSTTATTTSPILSEINNITPKINLNNENDKDNNDFKATNDNKTYELNVKPTSFLSQFHITPLITKNNFSPFSFFYKNTENHSNKSIKSIKSLKSTKSTKSNRSSKSNISGLSNYSSSTNSIPLAHKWTKSLKNQFNLDLIYSNAFNNFSYGINLTQTVFDYIKNVPVKIFTDTITNSINLPTFNFSLKQQSENTKSPNGRALIAKKRINKTNINISKLANSLYQSSMNSPQDQSSSPKTKNDFRSIDFNDDYIVDGIDVENISEDGQILNNQHSSLDLQEIQYKIETNKIETECILCQEIFNNGDELLALSCSHNFHSECITTWFVRKCLQGEGGGAFRCPICLLDPEKMDKSFISIKKNKSKNIETSNPISVHFDSNYYDSAEDLNSLYLSMTDLGTNGINKTDKDFRNKKETKHIEEKIDFLNKSLPSSSSSVSSLSTSPSRSPSSNLSSLPTFSQESFHPLTINNSIFNNLSVDDENISYFEDDILSHDCIDPTIESSENAKLSLLLFVQNTIIEKGEYKFYSSTDSASENNESISSTSSNHIHKTYSFCHDSHNTSFNFDENSTIDKNSNQMDKNNLSNFSNPCSLFCSKIGSNACSTICSNSNCIHNTNSSNLTTASGFNQNITNSYHYNSTSSKKRLNNVDISDENLFDNFKANSLTRDISCEFLDWSLCTEDSEP